MLCLLCAVYPAARAADLGDIDRFEGLAGNCRTDDAGSCAHSGMGLWRVFIAGMAACGETCDRKERDEQNIEVSGHCRLRNQYERDRRDAGRAQFTLVWQSQGRFEGGQYRMLKLKPYVRGSDVMMDSPLPEPGSVGEGGVVACSSSSRFLAKNPMLKRSSAVV